ncbi:hypothetical protein [Paraburkholderia aromaticivorans]|uniref:hypothetical protein n=1 Tax=Paraburkholderia aromaticivorans TaxID=2026199 RepID=UPI001455FE43|nr:hypothetical protein [Paraburkholderia aromaticivorans]
MALSARQAGARAILLERAPIGRRGGNSDFTGGASRIAYDGAADLRGPIPDLHKSEFDATYFGSYPATQFFEDAVPMSGYRADSDPLEHVIDETSRDHKMVA